jgi:hypothetical protein
MDKMTRRSHTAPMPIRIDNAVDSRAKRMDRLLGELDYCEFRLRAQRDRLNGQVEKARLKANIACNLGPQTTLETKVAMVMGEMLSEWDNEVEHPKLLHALHLCRKLRAAINGGCRLREETDTELAYVRSVVRGIQRRIDDRAVSRSRGE